jgi:uncharacterized membrane protein YphA (DoxX/SURF4 family)
MRGRRKLQRLFSAFPRGVPGVGLFLLRGAIGITAAAQGISLLAGRNGPEMGSGLVGMILLGIGLLLLIGLWTPLASALYAAVIVAISLSWIAYPATDPFRSPAVLVLILIMAVAIALIGPGSVSLDCRLFGRREIVIPEIDRRP